MYCLKEGFDPIATSIGSSKGSKVRGDFEDKVRGGGEDMKLVRGWQLTRPRKKVHDSREREPGVLTIEFNYLDIALYLPNISLYQLSSSSY